MSRARRYGWSLLSAYAATAVQILTATVSIPLILHYLSVEVYGLWTLVTQVVLFYQVVDIGFSEAFVRILIDYRSQGKNIYDSGLKTALVVFVIQGITVFVLVGLLLIWLPGWLNLRGDMVYIFQSLVLGQSAIYLTTRPMQILEQVFFVHERLDLSNATTIAALTTSFFALWFTLALGLGVWSLLITQVVMAGVLSVCRLYFCTKYRFIDPQFIRARFNREQFFEVFHYGKDRFLATLGDRLLRVIPSFVITRTMGLEANAVWSVCQKIVMMAEQILAKPIDTAYPFLAGMFVRKEARTLTLRYGQLVATVAALVGVAIVGVLAGLQPFVAFWTAGEIRIVPEIALAFAALLGIQMLKRSLWPVITIPKSMGWSKATNFIDLGLAVALLLQFSGTDSSLQLYVALLCVATFGTSVPYMLHRAGRFPDVIKMRLIFLRYRPALPGILIGLAVYLLLLVYPPKSATTAFLVAVFSGLLTLSILATTHPQLIRNFTKGT